MIFDLRSTICRNYIYNFIYDYLNDKDKPIFFGNDIGASQLKVEAYLVDCLNEISKHFENRFSNFKNMHNIRFILIYHLIESENDLKYESPSLKFTIFDHNNREQFHIESKEYNVLTSKALYSKTSWKN